MATLSELVDLDSGVASSEATPEGQTTMSTAAEVANIALAEEEILEVAKETTEAPEGSDKTDAPTIITTAGAAAAPVVPASGIVSTISADDEEDDDEDVDESIGERLMALTEMFPESLRAVSAKSVNSSVSLLKSSYNFTRQIVWVAVSTSIILFAPVMFELERLNVEEMMKQDRNRLVLGPGSAVSGAAGGPGGLMPPPPTAAR